MTDQWETPESHDATGGQPVAHAGQEMLLPTPSTPGYGTYVDHYGNHWTACTCVIAWLPWLERMALHLGYVGTCLDIWQCTGGATDSAGTHSQGGAVDTFQTTDPEVALVREMGAPAAWRRTTAQGFTKVHCHLVLNGCPHNTPAAYQLAAQKAGYDGLGYQGRGGKDYHPAPSVYRTWQQGIDYAKRELGLMAQATTTQIGLTPAVGGKGGWSQVTAKTTQPGTAYAIGTHVYDYFNVTTKTWQEFTRRAVAAGGSTVMWQFGGSHPIRVRYIPKDATASKPSTSPSANVVTVDVAALQAQVKTDQATIADLQAKLAAAGKPTP